MKTVYYNGTVYTGALPLVQAFVEEDGRLCLRERMRGSPDGSRGTGGADRSGRQICMQWI